MIKLVIGNKNYSSWSMRPWVLLREAGIAFEEVQLKFDDAGRIAEARHYSPAGQVPVLLIGSEPVWDSLAICEAAAEIFPEKQLWPTDALDLRRNARRFPQSAQRHADEYPRQLSRQGHESGGAARYRPYRRHLAILP